MLEDKYNCFLEANDETGEILLKKKIKATSKTSEVE
jgi:hypothetical protein